jgi:TonB-linked SusC/RagA family outer membrane protein
MRDFTFKKKWGRLIMALFLSFSVCLGAFAQTGQIIGKVIDSKTNEAIIGATVRIKDSNQGAATDVYGNFKINASSGQVLLVSYLGYQAVEVPVSGNSMTIKLTETNKDLTEVVVVGYGTEKKATLTGSIATVSAKAFQDRGVIDNPISAIQGTVPGTVVTRQSAAPGRENWNLQINGQTSTSGSDPLYIIDGVPVSVPQNDAGGTLTSNSNSNLSATLTAGNALSSLNPDDIESISILKDAAAAIYGARGAGGVVLITTKRGKAGKPQVTYDASVSIKALGLEPHLATGAQYGQGLVDAVSNDYGGNPPTNNLWYSLGKAYLGPYAGSFIDLTMYNGQTIAPANNPLNPGFGDVEDLPLFNTNALEQLYKNNTISTSHDLSVSGGSEKDQYRVSFGYLYDGSLLRYGQNSNNRYDMRFTNDVKLTDRLSLATGASLEENDVIQPTQIGIIYQFSQPGLPAFSENGQPYAWGTQLTPPGELQDGGLNIEHNTRIYTNAKLTYKITDHLDLVGVGGYNKTLINANTTQNAFTFYNYLGNYAYPATTFTQANSYDQKQQTTDNYYNVNAYLNYHQTFASKHNVALTIGTSSEKDKNDQFSAKTTDLFTSLVPSLNTGLGDATTHTVNEAAGQSAIQSYFARANYDYEGKYLLEADGRIDGSSKFAPGHQYHSFYGVSGGWVVSQEDFMKQQNVLSFLKLRASYGEVGNQNGIGLYDYINSLNVVYATSIVNGPPIIGSGTVVEVNPNSTLIDLARTWEVVSTRNAGIDVAFLNSRLSGSFDYYIKHNDNMLVSVTYPAVLGATAPQGNFGVLHTTGWDGIITWRDKVGKVSYHISANLSNYNDDLVKLTGTNIPGSGYNAAIQGAPLNAYYGLKYGGRIQTQAEANAQNAMLVGTNVPGYSAAHPLRPGDNSFVDVNHDGKINSSDYVYLGRDDPNYVGSMTFGAEYKGFDFNSIWQGVGKRTIYRSGNWAQPFGSIYQGQENFWVGKTWTPSNTSAYYPILSSGQNGTSYNTFNYQPSTWSVENGAYLRLKNLAIGYTFPTMSTKNWGISRLRIYVSGSDLLTFDSINDGWDPEQTRTIAGGDERYPFYKLYTLGANVTF